VERRKYRETLRALEPILPARDSSIEVFLWAGLAYGKLLESERAVEVCARGLKKFKNSPELLANMIIPLQRAGRLEDAEEICLKAVEIDSTYAGAPFSIGVAYMHAGDDEAAVKELQNALELEPDYPEALYCMGFVHNRLGQFRDALDYLKRAVALKPRYSEAFDQMTVAYEGLGDIDRALAATKSAAEFKRAYDT
jgi:tetratricopeptide (TPR) repeat protein